MQSAYSKRTMPLVTGVCSYWLFYGFTTIVYSMRSIGVINYGSSFSLNFMTFPELSPSSEHAFNCLKILFSVWEWGDVDYRAEKINSFGSSGFQENYLLIYQYICLSI